MDTDNARVLLEICLPAPRHANPRAASPEELDQMEAYLQMQFKDLQCTCGGDPILGDVFLTRTGHMDADWMCPLNWLTRKAEVH